jgi:hypothetical protein
MSENWEFDAEYSQLENDLRVAKEAGDTVLFEKIQTRLDQLDDIMWKAKTDGFPELVPFRTLVEALEQFCLKNNLPFPDLNNRDKNFTGDGRFLFGVGNRVRSIQIWPMEDRGYIDIEVYEYQFHPPDEPSRVCYQGHTSSVEEAAIVLSLWYVDECSIEELHNRFQWMSVEPFKLSGPRMTFD